MTFFHIVNTDNFDGDYPDESFLSITSMDKTCRLHFVTRRLAEDLADALNKALGGTEQYPASRFWKVVPEGYKLQPGFEP